MTSEDVFEDVRKAYGLLHEYHRRSKDTIVMFVRNLGGWGEVSHEKFVRGYSNRKRDVLTGRSWTWDFLPMHTAWYSFMPDGQEMTVRGIGELLLCITHCTDTNVRSPFSDASDEEPTYIDTTGRTGINVALYHIDKFKTSDEIHWIANVENGFDWMPEKTVHAEEKIAKGVRATHIHRFFEFKDMMTEADIAARANDFRESVEKFRPDLVDTLTPKSAMSQ